MKSGSPIIRITLPGKLNNISLMRKTRNLILTVLMVFVVLWGLQAFLVSANISRIRNFIETKSGNILEGELKTGRVEVSYFHTFPFLSLKVDDVQLTDSLILSHHEVLFYASHAYIRLNPFRLLDGSPVDKIIFTNGRFFSHTDSTGYSNRSAIKPRERKNADGTVETGKFKIPRLVLKNFLLHFDNPSKHNFYELNVKKLKAGFEVPEEGILKIALQMKARINRLTIPGSLGDYLFRKNINVRIGFELAEGKALRFSEANINVEGSPLIFDGTFDFNKEEPRFAMKIQAEKLSYDEALSFLSDSVKSKFDAYYFEKPLNFLVDIEGINDFKAKPVLKLVITTQNNTIQSPYGIFSDCSFRFLFHNRFLSGTENHQSAVIITNLTGKLKGLPIKADTITISGIRDPFLDLSFLQQSY
jgi:hypothetical protein